MSLSNKAKFLLVILDAAKVPFFEENMVIVPGKLKAPYDQTFYEIYKSLDGHGPATQLAFEYSILSREKVLLSLDEELEFHRYRLDTLKHPFYENQVDFSLADYKRFCHSHEKDCLKKGLAGSNWTNKLAEEHFGAASDPGDFFQHGAPAWKWQALKAATLDLYCAQEKIQLIRVPIYQTVMIKGQLVNFGKLFDSRQEENTRYISRFVLRQLQQKTGTSPV